MENKQIKINIDEVEYTTHSSPSYDKKVKWEHPDGRIITSIIPGTVVEILVKEGDVVNEAGDMLIIEAMKMNNQMKFPQSGIVDKIHVAPGDIVAKGQKLISLK